MTGTAVQYQTIRRDESMHCNSGIDPINTTRMDKPCMPTRVKVEMIDDLIS